VRRTTKSHARRVLAVLGLAGVLLTAGVGTDVAEAAPAAPAAPDRVETPAAPARAAQTGAVTKEIRYGPFTIDPAPENPDGTHGHAHLPGANLNVAKPCTNCFITGMKPDLEFADGTRAGYSSNVMLHHMVLFNQESGRTDATCPTGLGSLGQRFFASGDERTVTAFPDNFGYKVGANSSWANVWELSSMSEKPETVYFSVTFTYVPASTPGMKDVEPVWMDIDQCGDSHVSIPAGRSSQTWVWNVNRPGPMLTVGGHVHDYGINLLVRNDTTGQVICDSRASFGTDPLYIDHHGFKHISKMSTCGGPGMQPIAQLKSGDRVRITSTYDSPNPIPDAMGIAVAYMDRSGGTTTPPPSGSCVTATNQAHITAGRATAVFFFFATAKGSNNFLGFTFQTTSLRENPAGTWTMVASC
jgi:hypothetical protein